MRKADLALEARHGRAFVPEATVVALPWFVLATTGSTAKMGTVLACQMIPAVVLGLPAGALVSTLGPRRALVLADSLRAPLLGTVPVLHRLGLLSFLVLLVLVTAIGIFSVPYAAAASALLPDLVGENETEVARATAALQVAIQTTGVLGPAVAGLLIPLIGAPNLLLFDGASYAISAAIVAGFVRVGHARPRAERVRGLLVGVRHLLHDALLASIVAVAFVAHVGLAALFASLPALGFRSFHDARTAGVLFTADAVGSVLGGVGALSLARRVRPLRLGLAGFVLMSAPLWLLTTGASLPLALAALLCFGIGGPLSVSPITAVLTTRAPAAIRPQVISAFLAITTAGMPLGSAGAGFAIERVGFTATYVAIAAAMTLATILLVLFVRTDEAPSSLAAATPS